MAKKFGDLFGNMDDVFSGAKISNFDLDELQQTEALESCGAEITALRTKLDQLTEELEAAKNPTVTTVSDDDVSVS